MKVGVVSRSFPKMSNAEAAQYMKDNGFSSTELCLSQTDSNYWRYNGRSDLSDMTDERFLSIVNEYTSRGIEVAALGCFTNLIDEDEEERLKNLEYYYRHIELASLAGISFVSTECGFDPKSRGVRADVYEERFDRLKDSLTKLCAECEKYPSVCIALETCVIDIVPSAKRASDLLEQIDSKRLKILLDPANLIANSSEEDMFYYLSDNVAYLHGKDRRVNDAKGRVVGDGDIMWVTFLSLYHTHCEGKPFILEYVNDTNAVTIKDRVLEFDKLSEKL